MGELAGKPDVECVADNAGIPKFFRWVSERYPLTSQLITPNSIPTFDNLYLDMNGIIHNCSHPPSSENDVHFRISEEQMILAIFAYIDHLFTKIKPKKIFFMAIDGVAPRAKMNQQRSRRFRTARDAREKKAEAERKGEKLPEEKAFDSNCITPGTPFMARLSAHLKYYVTKRISEDAEWRNVKVILSGHDVPGEGEHKIQEFIRLSKAQPDYNPNTRHCLYGLDADLIMLGLLSHDPHFCLLREEVTFGRKTKKSSGLSHTNFFLLHLSLMREYLDLEFSSLAPQINFKYDLERIIDDFILMSIFVGNDFLPHLPDLHINEGALERIWLIYKEILPQAGGYLNEHGQIALPRLQLLLDKLGDFEIENYEAEYADQNWYKGKQQKEIEAMEKARKKGKLVITRDQQKILNQIKKFVKKHQSKPNATDRLAIVNALSARDRRFLQELADSLHLKCTWDEVDEYSQPLVVLTFDMEGLSEDGATGDEEDGEADGEWESEAEEDEGDVAIQRVFQKYEKAKVVENTVEDFEESYEEKLKENMDDWKKTYYKDKLEIDYQQPEQLRKLLFTYVEGLQWVLNYYYKGVPSWAWFYPYHFGPKITDLKGIAEFSFDFELGKPFTPYQQLMGVLPEDSKDHVPAAYRELMTDETSPIIDFYPRDFELDMNGKKQDWEAVVKIPFIDEARLLRAMAAREHRLTVEDKERNNGNVLSTQFEYSEEPQPTYASSQSGFFPDIPKCQCKGTPFNLPTLGDGIDLILGLLDGVHLGVEALAGFPSLQTLPHQGALGYHGVSVFQRDSSNPSMVITITSKHDRAKTADIAQTMIGERTFHSWPYLHEGMILAVSDDTHKYELANVRGSKQVVSTPHNPFQAIAWKKAADHMEHHHSKRYGVIIGNVDKVLHVRPLKGLKRLETGALVKDYEAVEKEIAAPVQLAVSQVTFEDERYIEQDPPPMADEFPNGERVIFLGAMAYGTAAQVMSSSKNALDISLAYFPTEAKENVEFTRVVTHRASGQYYPSPVLCRRLGLSALALSRVTSTLMVLLDDGSKSNIGLSLKFESKGLKVLGFSKRNDRGWEFSETTAKALEKYKAAFPEPFHNFDQRGGDIVTSAELCPTAADPDKVIKEMKRWLKQENLIDLEPVSLFAEQLEKGSVAAIERIADGFRANKTSDAIKRAVVKGIPRQAVLKPSHAIYRLQGQSFALGDRVIMVQDAAAGGVPLAMKGVVVGVATRDIDVVWDVPFMGGETLGGRCSEYRGSTVPFASCLNLTKPQFAVGQDTSAAAVGHRAPFQPTLGPQPVVRMQNFQPSIPSRHSQPVAVLQNPARVNGHATGNVYGNGHAQSNIYGNGVMHYGNAARGIRSPPVQPAQAQMGHHDRLASLLAGQQRLLAASRNLNANGTNGVVGQNQNPNAHSQHTHSAHPAPHVVHARPHAVVHPPPGPRSPVKVTTALPQPAQVAPKNNGQVNGGAAARGRGGTAGPGRGGHQPGAGRGRGRGVVAGQGA